MAQWLAQISDSYLEFIFIIINYIEKSDTAGEVTRIGGSD